MKLDDIANGPPRHKHVLHPAESENPFDEVLPDMRIIQATFLLDRKMRKPVHKSRGKQSLSVLRGTTTALVDNLDALKAACRRALLQDEASQIMGFHL